MKNLLLLSPANKSKSPAFFQSTKVESCKYVKPGYYAVPFRQSSKEVYARMITPSSEVASLNS